MARWGSVDYKQFKELHKQIDKLEKAGMEPFIKKVAKQLAARLLAMIMSETPVSDDPVTSGTLQRGWTGGVEQSVDKYADALPIKYKGKGYEITLINPVEYAKYVEYGHRTSNHKGWVTGRFFMTKNVVKFQPDAQKIVTREVEKKLREIFNAL